MDSTNFRVIYVSRYHLIFPSWSTSPLCDSPPLSPNLMHSNHSLSASTSPRTSPSVILQEKLEKDLASMAIACMYVNFFQMQKTQSLQGAWVQVGTGQKL